MNRMTRITATLVATLVTIGLGASTADAKQPAKCKDRVLSVNTVTFDDGTDWQVTKTVTRCRGKIAGYGELWEPLTP